jgi:predicted O-methyltransferase YrrM
MLLKINKTVLFFQLFANVNLFFGDTMNKIFRFALYFFSSIQLFSISLLAESSLPEPYASTKILPEYPFGYYNNNAQIAKLIEQPQVRTVLEVGSWIGGGSTRHIGNVLKLKGGTLYAVDTWLGSSTQQPGEPHYQPILSQVYEQFLSNMIHWGLAQTVVPIRMDSLTAAKTLNVQPDLIYIDGEHTTEAVYADLVAWYPFVEEKGIFCGDDWGWSTVQAAVIQFAQEKGKKIQASGNFWLLTD